MSVLVTIEFEPRPGGRQVTPDVLEQLASYLRLLMAHHGSMRVDSYDEGTVTLKGQLDEAERKLRLYEQDCISSCPLSVAAPGRT